MLLLFYEIVVQVTYIANFVVFKSTSNLTSISCCRNHIVIEVNYHVVLIVGVFLKSCICRRSNQAFIVVLFKSRRYEFSFVAVAF